MKARLVDLKLIKIVFIQKRYSIVYQVGSGMDQ